MFLNIGQEDKDKTGVYCIKSTVDDRLYIGSTVRSFSLRHKEHLFDLRRGKHGNVILQNFVGRYGIRKLQFEILEVVEDKEKILEREQYWIDRYWDTELLFNVAKEAESAMRGRKLSEEVKKKISLTLRGRKASEETKDKMSIAHKGNKSHTGMHLSEETKAKLRVARKGRKPALGHKHSEESKMQMSSKMKGRIVSEETRKKLSLAKLKMINES